jgi:hypothetical protein
VSRRVVSEKADTHAWPTRRPSTIPFKELIGALGTGATGFPLMVRLGCSHTFTFHYKLQGATNIHCDEFLTVFPQHLPVQKLVLYYPRPLTDFCTYPLTTVTLCNSESARTSVTTVLMSVAIASISKVFFMTKKECNVCNVKQRGGEVVGAE